MAAPTRVAARIDSYLFALLAEIADLPNVTAEWDSLSPAARASVSLDWDHLLADYLPELETHYHAAAMTAEQRERYGELRRQLQAALPLFERLGWLPIPVPLTD